MSVTEMAGGLRRLRALPFATARPSPSARWQNGERAQEGGSLRHQLGGADRVIRSSHCLQDLERMTQLNGGLSVQLSAEVPLVGDVLLEARRL